jgi:hypothetical protein
MKKTAGRFLPFTKAKTRYFHHTNDAGAQKWLAEA